MFRFYHNFNGVKALNFINGFRHFMLYSTSTISNPHFVNYLVESLGFSDKKALSTSTKLANFRRIRGTKNLTHFHFLDNANSVITYLKQIGLQQSQIAATISCSPQILLSNVDKTLKPKTETFLELGFSMSDFIEVVISNPSIYFLGENTTIVPGVQALIEILGCKGNVIRIMKKKAGVRLLKGVSKTVKPNVALLGSYGIPMECIGKCVLRSPWSFLRSTRIFEDVVTRVEEKYGIPQKSSTSFSSAVRILTTYGEKTIDSKIEVFKSFGWSESDVVALIRYVPSCLSLSEAKLKEKLVFLMNELGYEPKYVASRCILVTCSLEKRLVPRYKVLQALKGKDLMPLDPMDVVFYNAVCMNEALFLKKFVLPFKEIHEMYFKHLGISLDQASS